MNQFPKKLQKKIEERKAKNAVRSLGTPSNLIDFSSNDYLGLSTSEAVFQTAAAILKEHRLEQNGATGSRLLTGNHSLYELTETTVAQFHGAPAALIFNSGYDANVGFFGCVPQRGDLIFYDEWCHASIRDGITMSPAKSFKFAHNDLEGLDRLSKRNARRGVSSNPEIVNEVYVVTESVFSMDGDSPDLKALAIFCEEQGFRLVVDEAHAVGVFGTRGEGLIHELEIGDRVFARLVTFGKALGAHGAAILGSEDLCEYLINFARSLVYTTALPPAALSTVFAAYQYLSEQETSREKLHRNIEILQYYIKKVGLQDQFISSKSAIHSCVIPGNDSVKTISRHLAENGFYVKPIVSPTVPEGRERLRICLHSFNSEAEICALLGQLHRSIINERIRQV